MKKGGSSIFSFPTMFYTLSQTIFAFFARFELLSASALNLDKFNISSFGRVKLCLTQESVKLGCVVKGQTILKMKKI